MGTNRCSTIIFEKEHAARTIGDLDRLTPMVEALATFNDGVRIGLGCSGGRHRSRIIADALAEKLKPNDIAVNIIHPEGSMHQ